MNKMTPKLVVFMLSVFIISSCRKDEPIIPTEIQTGTLDLGNSISSDFEGRVIDANGIGIENVLISCGTSTCYTNEYGLFILKNVSVKEKLAFIKAEKSGYFNGSRSVIPSENSRSFALIQLMELNIAGVLNSGQAGSVSVDGGAKIDFNGDFVDEYGHMYNGSVVVAAKYLPPMTPSTFEQMPGMLYAQNSDGKSGVLATYGMIAVELFGSDGQNLQLAEGSFATLNMPVHFDQLENAPPTIPLWFFDEVAGYWIEDGSATLVEGNYVGNVSHFTFWNCDVFFESCYLEGTIIDNNGNPVGSANFTIESGGAISYGQSNSDGTFYTYLAASTPATFELWFSCGTNSPIVQTVGPFPANSNNSETFVMNSTDISLNISGSIVNCDGLPVTNGILYYQDDLNWHSYDITNGNVDFDLPTCISPTGQIHIFDYDQSLSNFSSTSITLTNPTTDLGQIIICDTIGLNQDSQWNSDEYMLFLVDGNVLIEDSTIEYSPLMDSLGNNGFYLCNAGETNYMIVGNNISSVGSYQGTQFGWPNAPNEIIFINGYEMDSNSVINYTTNVITYTGPGGILELSMTGTYTDLLAIPHVVDIYIHMNLPD